MTNQYWVNVRDLDVDALAEVGSAGQDIYQTQAVSVAFQRLQTQALQDAAKAQIRAAKAAEDTAKYTKNTAWWMMCSVIVLAVSSVLTLFITVWHGTR